MDNRFIYLDNNATTKVDDAVIEAMIPFLKDEYANPSSIYDFAKKSNYAVRDARLKVKNFLNANSEKEIIFTGSGSESATMAIKGVLNLDKGRKHIITSKVEHPCVLNLYKALEKQGYVVDYIDVDMNGELDLEQLKSCVNSDTALVSIMYANNETGVIFPIAKISEIIKSINPQTKFFVDAVQVAGKIKIDVQSIGVDLLSISGHKLHAPKGIGVLYVNSKTAIAPLVAGGHQERGRRAGTENVPYIVGLGVACDLATENLEYELSEVKRLRDKLESGILKSIFNAKANSRVMNRVPNTTNIGFEYIEGELLLLHLSDLGICASSGSACTSGDLEPSHVLRAMNVPFTSIHGSIRFSLSKYTTEADVDYVLEVLPSIMDKLTNLSPFQDELESLKSLRV